MRAREFTEPTAAGCILYAEDTGRWGLQQRSDTVDDPGLWAAWGGGREPGETLEQTARRELAEESGYRGPIKLEPLAKNAKYMTFIGIVPHEFEPRPCDEWKDYCWIEAGDWPSPMHPGVAAALKNIPIDNNLTEAFNQPYPMTWEHGEGSYDALVKLPDGTNLSIMFNQDYGDYGIDEWAVEFWRNNSQDVTGEGDAQRIFATVLSAIQHFIQEQHPDRIRFSATKEDDSGNPNQSRSSLYTKLVKRYANAWGYSVDVSDYAGTVVYELTNNLNENFADGKVKGKIKLSTDPNWYGAEVGDYRASSPVVNIPAAQLVGFEPDDKMNQPASRANVEKIVAGLKQGAKLPPLLVRKYKNGYQVLDGHHRFWAYKLLGVKSIPAQIVPDEDIDISENFADGKVKGKSRPGRVKRAGASCDGSVSSLRAKAKKYGGEKGKMYHWCANMKGGKKK